LSTKFFAISTLMPYMNFSEERDSRDSTTPFLGEVHFHVEFIDRLRYGRNVQIRRLAQEIIVTQQQEIAAMRLAVGDPLPPSVPSPTQPPRLPRHDHH
jgi:hypothetical protein